MPGSIGHPVSLGFPSLFGKTRDDTLRLRCRSAQGRLQVVPYGIRVPARRGGPGCPPFLSFLLWVSAPRDEVPSQGPFRASSGQALLFRQKDPKPVAPGRGPQEKPKVVILNAVKNLFFVGSRSLIESSFAPLPSATLPSATLRTSRTSRAGRTSAALRQSSPLKWKGRDRGAAPPAGARTTAKDNDSGSSRLS